MKDFGYRIYEPEYLETIRRIDSEVEAEVARAGDFARNSPVPDSQSAYQNIYA